MTNSDIIAAATALLGAKSPESVGNVVRVENVSSGQNAYVNFSHSPPVIQIADDETIHPRPVFPTPASPAFKLVTFVIQFQGNPRLTPSA